MLSGSPPPERSLERLQALFDYNPEFPLDSEESVIEERGGIAIHDVRYNAATGRTFGAYLVMPPGAGRFAGIIYVHPGPGSRDTFLDEAVMLARRGAVSLLVDAPWTEKAVATWGRTVTNPQNAVREHILTVIGLRRGIDLLAARPEVDAARLGYVGHSFGALIGGVLSAVEMRVRAYVLMAGTGSFTDVAVLNLPDLAGEALERYRRTLARDEFFPREISREFFEAASEPKSMRWYDAGHYLSDEAREDRMAWLSTELSLHSE